MKLSARPSIFSNRFSALNVSRCRRPDLPTVQPGGRSTRGSIAASGRWGSGTAASSASTWAFDSPPPAGATGGGAGAVGAAFEATAAGPGVAATTGRAAGGAVKSINCWGASTPTDLRTPASRCSTSGIACATGGRLAGGGPEHQHRLVELLDVVDEVLPLLGQPLHLRADRLVRLLEVAEAAPLLEHRPRLVRVELVAVLVERTGS